MKRILYNIVKTFNLREEELNAFKSRIKEIQLDKNEFFLEAGEICRSIAFLEKGSMRLFYESPEKEVCNDFLFENSVIGSFASFLSQSPSIVNIAAIEKCELLSVGYNDVMFLISKYPSIKRLSGIILQEQFIRAEKREASLIKLNPEERFKYLLEDHPKIFKRIPLHYVAGYLNITPETLSRYRSKFLV